MSSKKQLPILGFFIILFSVNGISNVEEATRNSREFLWQKNINDTLSNAKSSGIVKAGGKPLALLVGIDHYNTSKLKDLKHPAREITQLEKILKAAGYSTRMLVDHQATRQSVLDSLEKMANNRKIHDRILFYFAGHGMDFEHLQNVMGDDIKKQIFEKEIVAYNAAKIYNRKLDYVTLALHQTDKDDFKDVLGVHQIVEILSRSKAHQKMIIIDACFSGAPLEHFYLPVEIYSPRVVEDGFFAITGSKSLTRDGEHSPFLFAGLKGEADNQYAGNKDGYVSIYELAVFMDSELRKKYNDETGTTFKIRYIMMGSGDVRMVAY